MPPLRKGLTCKVVGPTNVVDKLSVLCDWCLSLTQISPTQVVDLWFVSKDRLSLKSVVSPQISSPQIVVKS